MRTEDYFAERAARANLGKAKRVLRFAGATSLRLPEMSFSF